MSPWIESTGGPIKIDIDVPNEFDITDTAGYLDLLASPNHNFVYDIDNNRGSPILQALGSFEDTNSTTNGFLASDDDSTTDNNPAQANQINIDHSIENVDFDRQDPA